MPNNDVRGADAAPHGNGRAQSEAETSSARLRDRRAASLEEARSITRDHARDLRTLLTRYVRRHLPPPTDDDKSPPEAPSREGTHARVLPVLRLVPAVLVLLFITSFFWDFPGLALFGYPLAGLLRIVSVSGLIGFLTNWLALTMLFHPRQKRPIFGQGLIPAQRERVIYRLAQAVSDELINEEMIKQKITQSQVIPRYRKTALSATRGVLEDPDFRTDVKGLVTEYVERVLTSQEVRQRIVDFTLEKMEKHANQSIAGLALQTYRFFNEEDLQRRIDRAVRDLPESLDIALDEMDHLLDRLPAQLEAHSADIEEAATRLVLGFVERLDVYHIIITNMKNYDERQLEDLIMRTSNEQLSYIKYLGGVLGFFGGLVIWEPLLALGAFVVVGGTLYALDVLLHKPSPS